MEMRRRKEPRESMRLEHNPKKGNSVERGGKRDEPGEQETTNDEENLEERVVRKVEWLFRNKDCIMIFSDHVIQKRTGTRNAEVCIRENDLEGIWDDLKPEVTAADKKKQEIKNLREGTIEKRRKLQEKRRAMNIMLWKQLKCKRVP